MQRLLLDSHAFLWWINDSPELSTKARRAIADTRNECCLSIVSCWELSIKSSLGKLSLAKPIGQFISEHLAANGFSLLGITLHHTAMIEHLPFHHRDPFDRLLIAQAIAEKLTIVSSDKNFAAYDVSALW